MKSGFKGTVYGGPPAHVLSLRLFLLGMAWACAESESSKFSNLKDHGLRYTEQRAAGPVPNRIHILRVELDQEKVEPLVILAPDPDGDGPVEAVLTDPRELVSRKSVNAFINTNPWDSFPDAEGRRDRRWRAGQPVEIIGLAGTGGKMRSGMPAASASVWFNQEGRVRFGHQETDSPVEAITGFQVILGDGELVVQDGGARHPRTAIGAGKEGKILWLVVVDGRQPGYSEGMTLGEIARVMRKLGCWVATNLDGGGSSVMGLVDQNGRMKIVNQPPGGSIRPLPMILALGTPKVAGSKER